MKAYHTFELTKEPGEWIEIELLVQFLSILYWKKSGNEIGLFANERFVELLRKYKLDEYYSEIKELNTDNRIDTSRFWAMPKILCHQQITESEYCVLDTDMFLRKLPVLKPVSYVAAHCEWHYSIEGKFVYPNLSTVLTGEKLERFSEYADIMPTNTSFLYINDTELVKNWVDQAIETAVECSSIKSTPVYGEMMTIEQRFLPIITRMMNKRYSVLISNSYVPALQDKMDGSEWTPHPEIGGNLKEIVKDYFHLWGFKRNLGNKSIKDYIIQILIAELKQNFETEYNIIIDKFTKIKNQI